MVERLNDENKMLYKTGDMMVALNEAGCSMANDTFYRWLVANPFLEPWMIDGKGRLLERRHPLSIRRWTGEEVDRFIIYRRKRAKIISRARKNGWNDYHSLRDKPLLFIDDNGFFRYTKGNRYVYKGDIMVKEFLAFISEASQEKPD